MEIDSRRGSPPPPTRGAQRELHDSRKRMNSPTFDDYDGPEPPRSPHPVANKLARRDYAWEMSPRQGPRHTSPESSNRSSLDSGPPRQRKGPAREGPSQMSHQPEQALPRRPPPSPSPPPEAYQGIPPEHSTRLRSLEPEEEFGFSVDDLVKNEDNQAFQDFFHAKAGSKYSDILRQYDILLKLIKKYVGRKIPRFDIPIEEVSCFAEALVIAKGRTLEARRTRVAYPG